MINNWNYHGLRMDFSGCNCGYGQPSDIDMFFIGRDGTLILGEIKNEHGQLSEFQKKLLQQIADNYKGDAIILYMTHDKLVQNGDTDVDVSKLFVDAYYWKGKWCCPTSPTTVKDVIKKHS